jgi:hypothetical protein
MDLLALSTRLVFVVLLPPPLLLTEECDTLMSWAKGGVKGRFELSKAIILIGRPPLTGT